jgi:hypothetical protein
VGKGRYRRRDRGKFWRGKERIDRQRNIGGRVAREGKIEGAEGDREG